MSARRSGFLFVIVLSLGIGPSVLAQEGPLTLPDAVALVRSSSPMVKAAMAQLEGARLATRFAGRLPNPGVDIQIENIGYRSRPPGVDNLGHDIFALVSQPIELGGKRAARVALADADRELAEAALALVTRQITLDTVDRYVAVVRAREAAGVLGSNADELAALIENLQLRVAAGIAPEADLLKFRTEAGRLELRLARVQRDLARSAAQLSGLLGRLEPLDAGQLVAPPPMAPPPGDALALAVAARATHPEILVARARLRQAREAATMARAQRVPDPVVTGGYKGTGHEHTGVLGMALTLPLFTRNQDGVARAEAAERAAAHELESIEQRLPLEIAAAVENARRLADQAARAETDVLEPAAIVRDASEVAFREGATDVLALVDAQRVHAEARRELVDLRLDAFLSATESRLALGLELLP